QNHFLEECLRQLAYVNRLLWPVFKDNVFDIRRNKFGFQGVNSTLVYNKFEGQIHTGMMMKGLLKKAQESGVEVFFGAEVSEFKKGELRLTNGAIIPTENIAICTNGFGGKFGFQEVKPARAQVLITEEIPDLKLKGTFHLDEGYYYFRNIGKRILLGGGRNLDFSTEETSEFGCTSLIQNRLDQLLKEVIHPQTKLKVEQRWSGIMGVGSQKKPIIKKVSPGIYCGLRLGGMGVALGSQVGSDLANLI
ncbi:MAG: NAD(P)/FAD-dependent oxidoreductase, partial [Flavobacteriaceae bacterium]